MSRACTLLAMLLAIRLLGKVSYGLLALTQSTVLMSGTFLGLGLGIAATKFISERGKHSPTDISNAISLLGKVTLWTSFFLAAVLFGLRHFIAITLLQEEAMSALLGLSAPLLVVTTYSFFQQGVLTGFGAFKTTAVANAIVAVVSIPIVFLGVWHWGTTGAVLALTFTAIASCLIYRRAIIFHACEANIELSNSQPSFAWKLLLTTALPSVLMQVVNAPADWFCFAMLAHQADGIAEVGVYCAANQWCQLLRFLPLSISASLLPKIAKEAAQTEKQDLRQTPLLGLGITVLATFPILLALVLASPWIVNWYGPVLEGRLPVLTLLLASGTAISLHITGDRILTGLGFVWTTFGLNVTRAVLFCGFASSAYCQNADNLAAARCMTCALHAVMVIGIAAIAVPRIAKRCRVRSNAHQAPISTRHSAA